MFRTAFAATVIAAVALVMIVKPADAQPRRIQVGTLTCSVSAGVGLIVGSQRNVNCLLKGQPGEPEEAYTGTMTRVGLDVGVTTGGAIIWADLRYQSLRRNARRYIHRGVGGGVRCRRSRCQCAGGGIEPDGGAAAIVGAGPDRARCRRWHRPVGVASGPVSSDEAVR